MGPEPELHSDPVLTEPDGWVGYFTGTDIAQKFPRHEPVADQVFTNTTAQ